MQTPRFFRGCSSAFICKLQTRKYNQAPLNTWQRFIRRVTYHVPEVTKQHEQKVIPSIQALICHSGRANYVLKLAVSASILYSPFLHYFEQFGWHRSEGSVQITWDNNDEEQRTRTAQAKRSQTDKTQNQKVKSAVETLDLDGAL